VVLQVVLQRYGVGEFFLAHGALVHLSLAVTVTREYVRLQVGNESELFPALEALMRPLSRVKKHVCFVPQQRRQGLSAFSAHIRLHFSALLHADRRLRGHVVLLHMDTQTGRQRKLFFTVRTFVRTNGGV